MLLSFVFYVAGLTIATMLAFAWDKICARKGWRRVAEGTLLTMAAMGGTVGAIAGQQIMRHKTRKQPFRTYLYTIGAVQAVGLAALSIPPVRDAALATLQQFILQ